MANVANNQHAPLTTTSYVDIVGAGAGSRLVSNINVANTDAAVPISVTIALDDNGTVRVLVPSESIDANSYRQFGPYVLKLTTGTNQKLKAKLSATGTVDVVSIFADA